MTIRQNVLIWMITFSGILIANHLLAQDTVFYERRTGSNFSVLDKNFEYTNIATVIVNQEDTSRIWDARAIAFDKPYLIDYSLYKNNKHTQSLSLIRTEMTVYAPGYDTLHISKLGIPNLFYLIPSGGLGFDQGGGYMIGPQFHSDKLCVVLKDKKHYTEFVNLIKRLELEIVGDSCITPWHRQLEDRVYLLKKRSGTLAMDNQGKCPVLDSIRHYKDLFLIAGPAINRGLKESDIFTIDEQLYIEIAYGNEKEVAELINNTGFFPGKVARIEYNYLVVTLDGYTIEGLNELIKKAYTLPHVKSAFWNSLLFCEIPDIPQPIYPIVCEPYTFKVTKTQSKKAPAKNPPVKSSTAKKAPVKKVQ